MIIYGTDGDSGKLYLTPSDGSKFAKGKTYGVIVDVPDIGDVSRLNEKRKLRNRVMCSV